MQVQASASNDQLIRQTRAHHVQLSAMADLKANMLLTMASLVITLSVPNVLEGIHRMSISILVAFCLATIMLAAYASMPKVPLRYHHPDNPAETSPLFNILFFGDFARLTYDEFENAMADAMRDPEAAYRTQVNEIYAMGIFLATKKYRFLRLAYVTFITGLVLSGISLGIGMYLPQLGL